MYISIVYLEAFQGCDIEREVSKLSVYLFVYQHLPSKGNISNMVDKYSGFIYFYGIDLSGLKKIVYSLLNVLRFYIL